MDNVEPGIKAANKHKNHYEENGINAYIIHIPKYMGKDIDDLVVRYGIVATKKWLKRKMK